jgi:hypothetical protein
LLRSCKEQGFTIAGDFSVCERDAGLLLGYSENYFKTKKDKLTIPRRQVGSRWRYRLSDLAQFIENTYENGSF